MAFLMDVFLCQGLGLTNFRSDGFVILQWELGHQTVK
jgi:hypothetical protein